MGKTTGITTAVAIKEETVKGDLVVPAGTDGLPIVADPEVMQNKTLAESLERINSYSLLDLLSLRYNAGTMTLGWYMKRTGVVDTVVTGIDTALKNALGRKTTNAGVSVVYNLLRTPPTDTPLTFSMFVAVGGIVLQASGCFINDLSFPFQADPSEAAEFRATGTGEFYRMRWAGSDVLTEDLTATDPGLTKFNVLPAHLLPNNDTSDADVYGKYCVGSFVMCGNLTTSHEITDIDPATGDITVTPAFGSNQVTGASVRGYFPTLTSAGAPMSAHMGFLNFDSQDFAAILSGTLHHTLPRRVLVEEKNNQDYPSDDAIEGRRMVTMEDTVSYFDPTGTPPQDLEFALEHEATRKAILLNIGNRPGYRWQFSMPYSILKEPKLSGEGIVQMARIWSCLASAGDDEMSLKSW
jgi:hypothetical protein